MNPQILLMRMSVLQPLGKILGILQQHYTCIYPQHSSNSHLWEFNLKTHFHKCEDGKEPATQAEGYSLKDYLYQQTAGNSPIAQPPATGRINYRAFIHGMLFTLKNIDWGEPYKLIGSGFQDAVQFGKGIPMCYIIF